MISHSFCLLLSAYVYRSNIGLIDADLWILWTVEYQTFPSLEWYPAKYEASVVMKLLQDQFHNFVSKVKTTDCQAELRRLLAAGPPVYISDKHALPLPENGDTHISQLWFSSDNQERSAKLDGAVEGEEREKLWDELKQFIIVEGQEPGDEEGTD